MQWYPRGKMKMRLAIYATILGLIYAFLWFCCRAFNLPAMGRPGGDLAAIETRLRADVSELAEKIGERNFFMPEALEKAARFISGQWTALGLKVAEHRFQVRGADFKNLEVDLGGPPDAPLTIVGAHYDTVGCAGADDNGSGVAAMLELSRQLIGAKLGRRLRFVAFTNEEPPFFDTDEMGSRVYAKMAQARGDRIELMVSLETIAFYKDEPKSQKYPVGLGHFYPDRGNFIGVVGDLSSRSLVQRTAGLLAGSCDIPVECASLPGRMPGVFWSDHSSFWTIGVPAVMITDTAYFRNPNYHRHTDRPGTLDFPRLARLTAGLVPVVRQLAGGQ